MVVRGGRDSVEATGGFIGSEASVVEEDGDEASVADSDEAGDGGGKRSLAERRCYYARIGRYRSSWRRPHDWRWSWIL